MLSPRVNISKSDGRERPRRRPPSRFRPDRRRHMTRLLNIRNYRIIIILVIDFTRFRPRTAIRKTQSPKIITRYKVILLVLRTGRCSGIFDAERGVFFLIRFQGDKEH